MLQGIARQNENLDCWEIRIGDAGWQRTPWAMRADFNCVTLFFKAQGISLKWERGTEPLPKILRQE
jgi:hypothetical protein